MTEENLESPQSTASMNRAIYLVLGAVFVIAASFSWFYLHGERQDRPYIVGLVTWIGYGPFYIAEENGYFEDEGLDIELAIMDASGQRETAYHAGEIDFFPNTPDAFVIMFSEHKPSGRLVGVLDRSNGGDGIIAKTEITSLRDLKGKKVGFQDGITSHFLLLHALDHDTDLTGEDIIQENLDAGEAGAAFMAGQLDAAVTWEPWLSKAKQSKQSHVLATSADYSGLIADVVLTSDNVLREDPDSARKLMKAWYRALKFLKKYPDESHKIIAKNLHLPTEEVAEMLKTVSFFSELESEAYLNGTLNAVGQEASKLYLDNDVIRTSFDIRQIIDTSVLYGR